jgi:hypothetical protein
MIWLAALVLMVASALSGCVQTSPAVSTFGAQAPALLVQPSDASQQELRATVARMMGVASVSLAKDVFLATSLMVIEKNRPRGADGIQLSGRDFDKPEQFRLLKSGNQCVLVKLSTGAHEVLQKSQCEAER